MKHEVYRTQIGLMPKGAGQAAKGKAQCGNGHMSVGRVPGAQQTGSQGRDSQSDSTQSHLHPDPPGVAVSRPRVQSLFTFHVKQRPKVAK